uniref:CARD domain-containing protein n=1 Tax=Amphilophus citrinellus TaxID=61819 RepID=A0A3Q0SCH5_AMPCI
MNHPNLINVNFFLIEKELGRVRSKFIEKTSRALLDQLLDDILEDGILNDGERESIAEENRNRADKARCLIDTVRKKGEVASKKMICHIQQRDPTLYSDFRRAYKH